MARVARMPLADEALAVFGSALRDPNVVLRYQPKIVAVPWSDCLWWSGAVSGRGHGRNRAKFQVGQALDLVGLRPGGRGQPPSERFGSDPKQVQPPLTVSVKWPRWGVPPRGFGTASG